MSYSFVEKRANDKGHWIEAKILLVIFVVKRK